MPIAGDSVVFAVGIEKYNHKTTVGVKQDAA